MTIAPLEEQEVLVPSSPDEAVAAFGDGSGVTVVAGGTIVMPEITAGRLRPARALLLSNAGLDRIETRDGVLRIGAAVPVSVLEDAPEPLATAARFVADYEIRSQATLGGNLCAGPGRDFPRGDLQAPLIALDARVRSAGGGEEWTEPVENFLSSGPSGRLVLELEIDVRERRAAVAGLVRLHTHSYTPLAVAATSAPDGSDLRVAAGGVGPYAVRLRSVERAGVGGDGTESLADVQLEDDALASAWYRQRMLPVLVRRALTELKERP